MRIAITFCAALLAATPALAREGNPLGGIGVSVEQSGAGITVVRYNNANDARAACMAARGTWSNTSRRGLRCSNPRAPLRGFIRPAMLPDPAERN